MLPGVEGSGEDPDVKPDLFGVSYEVGPVKHRRSFYQQVVHLPVFSLIAGSQRCLCGYMREVPVFIRIVLDDKPYLAFESLYDFFYDRTGRNTMRSLEINEFYDRDRSVLWAIRW